MRRVPRSRVRLWPLSSFTPNPTTDLFMDAGDRINLALRDSADGLVVGLHDLTSGQSGSMTASVANGFAQVNFDPTAAACTQKPYAFHPMYATSGEHTRVPWAAHSYNVSYADEIGHFELCSHANVHGKCVNPTLGDNNKKDGDDARCFNADESLRILDRYRIDVVLWDRTLPLVTLLRADGRWRQVYRNQDWVVLQRTTNSPRLGG